MEIKLGCQNPKNVPVQSPNSEPEALVFKGSICTMSSVFPCLTDNSSQDIDLKLIKVIKIISNLFYQVPRNVLFYMYNLIVLKNKKTTNYYLHTIDKKRNGVSEKVSYFPIGGWVQTRPVYFKPLKYHISAFLGFSIQIQREKDAF